MENVFKTDILTKVRKQKPLVHHITNYVTVNDCANAVLALGAAPVMADEIEEVGDIVSISSALVINIGTLNQRTSQSMLAAGKRANELGIPAVLDPVGAGASRLRTETAERLIKEIKFAVIRGNISEIKMLGGTAAQTKGVDAAAEDAAGDIQSHKAMAERIARELGCVIAITGATDIISDGTKTYLIQNGHPMMAQITGTGCMCTSLIASCCGVTRDYLAATVTAVTAMGLAGEKGYARMKPEAIGNATYRNCIIDAIYGLNEESLYEGGRLLG